MTIQDDDEKGPLFRYRRSIEIMIETLKNAVPPLHAEASQLKGREARELREIADDMDSYAEELKTRLKRYVGR